MPQGYAVFLMNNGGGMEYFGGTISSLNALAHETFHMYVGTSLVLSSYRDSWLDEAINKWYELSAINSISPISDNYSSNLISGFSPVGLGFDRRAYNEGAQIMEHISRAMGGRSQMIGFLHFLIENYSFQPFSTTDFLTYLYDYSGLDYQQHFNSWLYSGETITLSGAPPAEVAEKHHIDLNPPWEILKNYPELTIGGKSCHD
jgi:aminopeptidase N